MLALTGIVRLDWILLLHNTKSCHQSRTGFLLLPSPKDLVKVTKSPIMRGTPYVYQLASTQYMSSIFPGWVANGSLNRILKEERRVGNKPSGEQLQCLWFIQKYNDCLEIVCPQSHSPVDNYSVPNSRLTTTQKKTQKNWFSICIQK